MSGSPGRLYAFALLPFWFLMCVALLVQLGMLQSKLTSQFGPTLGPVPPNPNNSAVSAKWSWTLTLAPIIITFALMAVAGLLVGFGACLSDTYEALDTARINFLSGVLYLILFILIGRNIDQGAPTSWLLIFLPLYISTSLDCLFGCYNSIRLGVPAAGIGGLIGTAINITQFVLIGAKLDGLITAGWEFVFIPLWITLSIPALISVLVCVCGPVAAMGGGNDQACGIAFAGFFVLLLLAPVVAFLIQLVLILDGVNAISVAALLAPLYIYASIFTLGALVTMCNGFVDPDSVSLGGKSGNSSNAYLKSFGR